VLFYLSVIPNERIDEMNASRRLSLVFHILPCFPLIFCGEASGHAQQIPEVSTIIHGVDTSVNNRIARLAGYTATEHYAVFRGHDGARQVADMVVKTTYRRESGKSYTIVSQSGSSFWRNEVLNRLLDNEKRMSRPANLATALINSTNYEIKLDRNPVQNVGGRQCILLDIAPRRNSEYLFKGTLSVDAHDYSIVQLKGTAGKSAFFLASAAGVTRQYVEINDLPMATHAEAVSGGALLGQTMVKIDYSNYQLDLTPGH
jgi:hypothetical protein